MNRNKTKAAPAKAISFKIGIDIPRLSLFWAMINHPTTKATAGICLNSYSQLEPPVRARCFSVVSSRGKMVSLHNPASEPCMSDKQARRTPGAPGPSASAEVLLCRHRSHCKRNRQRLRTHRRQLRDGNYLLRPKADIRRWIVTATAFRHERAASSSDESRSFDQSF